MSVSLSSRERQALLSQWIKPSSGSEQARQERATRMVEDAIRGHRAFNGTSISVYAKGSYANGTNVRLDSDVDIVVENHDCYYFDYFGSFDPPIDPGSAYLGFWTPDVWRKEVTAALTSYFGSSEVDATGDVAIGIAEKDASRPSVDVVPAFLYYRYDSPDRRVSNRGSKVVKRLHGSVINWPQQQLDNGRSKNVASRQRYKSYVRALKNAENHLAQTSVIEGKPSYFMECLVWNVPDGTLVAGDLDDGFRATLVWLWERLTVNYQREEWEEPNRLQYLFHTGQKWSTDDAKELVLETWRLLGY